MRRALGCLLALAMAPACSQAPPTPKPVPVGPAAPAVAHQPFGKTADGQAVEIYTLRNSHGLEVKAISYGAIITSIRTPDVNGTFADIVLGFDTLDGYLRKYPRFGATGFDRAVWSAQPLWTRNAVEFSRAGEDRDEGSAARLSVIVTYELTDRDELVVEYRATAARPAPANLTQHMYLNLKGEGSGDILDHEVLINADRFTRADGALTPEGELHTVERTPFDFRTSRKIGARIDEADDQLKKGKGYDHNWVLNRSGDGLQPAAVVHEATSGRMLSIETTEPVLQFYTGNLLDGTITGKGGHAYQSRSGFCLETRRFPESLGPGEVYHSRTVFKFGVVQ